MRIAHLADLHFTEEHYSECDASIQTVISEHEVNPFDLIVIAGDTWDGPVQNSARARFGGFLGLIASLAECAPVAMIYGTPSHDTEGSLEVFETLLASHPIMVLQPGQGYYLSDVGTFNTEPGAEPFGKDLLLLFGVPEPNKRWLLAGQSALGKDESAAAVRAAMSRLFFGLGAKRALKPELPCLLMFHGQVSGAKSGTGFEVEGGTGLAVSRDDLAAVGADYIALGDIHEPQQIPGLIAYYPGSIYPATWGETHKAGCNVVELGEDGTKVTRLEFPHPQRIKVSERVGDEKPRHDPLQGKLVWLEVTGTKAEIEECDDAETILASMLKDGALPGSRVTFNVLPSETVRAGQIAANPSLRSKVGVYAENSGLTPTEGALEKADELEREAKASGIQATGAHIRINRLRLRGAKGIWKNQRIDEIDLNLDAYGPGVIAMLGKNGQGKTTILENLQPWGRMLTRDGTLKSHFRLRDSFRDLCFTDERTGWKYRALIQINAATASGSAEYFLFRDQGQGFEPVPGLNGRSDPYDEAVTALFGSQEMYLRTAFVTQRPTKGAPDLAEATKGEKKALFAELSGIDYLERYREACKARGDALETDLKVLEATIAAGQGIEAEISENKSMADQAVLDEAGYKVLSSESESRGKLLAAEADALTFKLQELENQAKRKGEIEAEIETLVKGIKTSEIEARGFASAAAARGEAEATLAKIKDLEGQAAAMRDERAILDEANQKARTEYQAVLVRIVEARRVAQATLDTARHELADVERSIAVLESKLTAPIADHCPTCAQLLPEDKRLHLQEERVSLEAQLRAIFGMKGSRDEVWVNAQAALSALVAPVPPEPAPFPGAAALADIEDSLDCLDSDAAREILRKADEAAVKIEAAQRRVAEKEARSHELAAQIDPLAKAILEGHGTREALAAKQDELRGERTRYTEAQASIARARAVAEAAVRAIEGAQKRLAARDEAQGTRDLKTSTLADWRFLETAAGPDGIQALELDALAPSIAAVANRLIAGANGSRYSIRFDTQRTSSGSAKKAHQIEDFLVMVQDSETGEEQEIATLSGGEAVWVKRALYDAFAVIRAQNTGTRFLTCFQDETDGALDSDARMRYLRMLEAAHRESGRHQTILITHSTELQAMVEQSIDVTRLEAREEAGKESAA